MKKGIKTYALISDLIALELCVHAGIFYLLNSNNDRVGGDGFFGFTMAITFGFMFFNGVLMTIAGIYLVVKDFIARYKNLLCRNAFYASNMYEKKKALLYSWSYKHCWIAYAVDFLLAKRNGSSYLSQGVSS